MENQLIEDIKELFQSFIAPALEGIKGDIRALDTKIDAVAKMLDARIDAKVESLDTKIDLKFETLDAKMGALDSRIQGLDMKVESYRREVVAEVHRVEQVLSTDFVRLEQKVDLRLASMDERMDLFRRELLAEIKAAVR